MFDAIGQAKFYLHSRTFMALGTKMDQKYFCGKFMHGLLMKACLFIHGSEVGQNHNI